jgi:hypothetical protein
MMECGTIAMDEELVSRRRRPVQSVSRYLAEAGREKMEADEPRSRAAERNRQMKALERVLTGPMWDVTEDGRMPTAEERNARR